MKMKKESKFHHNRNKYLKTSKSNCAAKLNISIEFLFLNEN